MTYGHPWEKGSTKFMLSLPKPQVELLMDIAMERHVTIQELLRAVVIPEWQSSRVKREKRE